MACAENKTEYESKLVYEAIGTEKIIETRLELGIFGTTQARYQVFNTFTATGIYRSRGERNCGALNSFNCKKDTHGSDGEGRRKCVESIKRSQEPLQKPF